MILNSLIFLISFLSLNMMKSEPYWEPLQPISNFPAVPLSEPESDIFLSLKDAA